MRKTGGGRARVHRATSGDEREPCPDTTTRKWRRHNYEGRTAIGMEKGDREREVPGPPQKDPLHRLTEPARVKRKGGRAVL
jgi:hypothetical protein